MTYPMRRPTPPAQLYGYWRDALATSPHEARRRRHDGDMAYPQAGFYRLQWLTHCDRKHLSQFVPVAIWFEQPVDENGELTGDEYPVAREGDSAAVTSPLEVKLLWRRVWDHPVSEGAYRHALAHGNWADDAPPFELTDVTKTPALF